MPFEHWLVTDSNVDATRESGEPILPGDPVGRTVWYAWTAPANGYLDLKRRDSTQSVVLAIYSGLSLEHLTLLTHNAHRMGSPSDAADFIWQTREEVGVVVRSGELYHIAADTHIDGVDPGWGGLLFTLPSPEIDVPHLGLPGLEDILGGLTPDPSATVTNSVPTIQGGTIAFSLDFTPAPANDTFVDAVPLSGLFNTVVSTNLGASAEVGEPVYTNQPGGASVWWSWTPTISGQVVVGMDAPLFYPAPSVEVLQPAVDPGGVFGVISTTDGGFGGVGGPRYTIDLDPLPTFAPILSVYRGQTLATLEALGRGSNITFNATAGQSYRIAFEGQQSIFGSITFYVTQTPPPSNDKIDEALPVLDASRALLNGYTVSTTRELIEPDLGVDYSGGSAWFRWVAPTYGSVSLWQTSGSSGSANSLAVFSRDSKSGLIRVTSSAQASVIFFGEAGVEYWFAVYAGGGSVGSFQLQLEAPQLRYADINVSELPAAWDRLGFSGVLGRTAFLLAKTTSGWACRDTSVIEDGGVSFTTIPSDAVDSMVRLVTIDELLPLPRLAVEMVDGKCRLSLHGVPGQSCEVLTSSDLQNWTSGTLGKLTQPTEQLGELEFPASPLLFYRVTAAE